VIYQRVPFSYRLKGFMILFSILAMHAWFWSIRLHAQDGRTNKMMSCFAFGLFTLYAFYFTMLYVFKICNGRIMKPLGTLCIYLFVAHVGSMIIVSFNTAYNTIATFVLGFCTLALWTAWCVVHCCRPYTHLAVISGIGVVCAMLFTVFDFPPLGRVLDAHSLWHLSTIPLTILVYRFLMQDMYYETKTLV
jgi:hypothetical protein